MAYTIYIIPLTIKDCQWQGCLVGVFARVYAGATVYDKFLKISRGRQRSKVPMRSRLHFCPPRYHQTFGWSRCGPIPPFLPINRCQRVLIVIFVLSRGNLEISQKSRKFAKNRAEIAKFPHFFFERNFSDFRKPPI